MPYYQKNIKTGQVLLWKSAIKFLLTNDRKKEFEMVFIGGFEIRDYKLNTKADDARKAREEGTIERGLNRKKKEESRQPKIGDN